MKQILLYCREGFEADCAAEIQHHANEKEAWGFVKTQPGLGHVIYETHIEEDSGKLYSTPIDNLIFARQLVRGRSIDLNVNDRVGSVMQALPEFGPFSELRVEFADTNEGKALNRLAKKLAVPLRQALKKRNQFRDDKRGPVLHLFLYSGKAGFIGTSDTRWHSPLVNGIQRLRQPSEAPSRSTLKLDEAFLSLLTPAEREQYLQPGMKAIDMGASPGGWTYQLVRRSMFVTAVDNGKMDPNLMETGQVDHLQEDAFKFVPRKLNISWVLSKARATEGLRRPENPSYQLLVCDMVEKPQRVSDLMIQWFDEGWTRMAVFNLKLPMKKRYEVVAECLNKIQDGLSECNVQIRAKHLYHDREEITVVVMYP